MATDVPKFVELEEIPQDFQLWYRTNSVYAYDEGLRQAYRGYLKATLDMEINHGKSSKVV